MSPPPGRTPIRDTFSANLNNTQPQPPGKQFGGEWELHSSTPAYLLCPEDKAPFKFPPPVASTQTPRPGYKDGQGLLTRHLGPQCLSPAASSHLQFPGRAEPACQLSCPLSTGTQYKVSSTQLFHGALGAPLDPTLSSRHPGCPSLQTSPASLSLCSPGTPLFPAQGRTAWPTRPLTGKACFPFPSTAPLSSSPSLTQRTISQFGELSQTWVGDQLPEKSLPRRTGQARGFTFYRIGGPSTSSSPPGL